MCTAQPSFILLAAGYCGGEWRNEMFKYKVSVYMKSGNIIHIHGNKNLVLSLKMDWTNKEIIVLIWQTNNCPERNVIEKSEIEALVIKKWWQRWG